MTTLKRFSGLTAVVALGVAAAMPQAHAFNPQPDPPAKQRMLNASSNPGTQKGFTYQRNTGASRTIHIKPSQKSAH